jgi:hypothetical protein
MVQPRSMFGLPGTSKGPALILSTDAGAVIDKAVAAGLVIPVC